MQSGECARLLLILSLVLDTIFPEVFRVIGRFAKGPSRYTCTPAGCKEGRCTVSI